MLWLRIFLLMLACVAKEADALAITAAAPVVTQTGTASWSLGDAAAGAIKSASRTWATDGIILSASDSVTMAGLAGDMTLGVTAGATAALAYALIGGCIASVVCAGSVAAVGALAAALRMKAHGDGTGVDWDAGVPQEEKNGVLWYDSLEGDSVSYPSADAACKGGMAKAGGTTFRYLDMNQAPPVCAFYTPYGGSYVNVSSASAKTKQCPDPSVSPGFDGQCPSGAYAPITEDELRDKLRQAGGLGNAQVAGAAEQAVDLGGQSMSATSSKISGPGYQVGPTTQTQTTSAVDAQGNASTSTTSVTPTYNYNYSDGGVSATTTTTTKVTNSDGSSTTTTSGPAVNAATGSSPGTGTGSSAGTSAGTSSDTSDLCALHPDVLACDKLGTPPTDTPVWSSKEVSFAVEDLGLPSGCPASRVWTVHGFSLPFNYQPACDIAPTVRAALVALCALGCSLWIMSTIRG